MTKLNVLIAGSTGYIGMQLIKILAKHKKVNIKYLCANTSTGKKITHFLSIFNCNNFFWSSLNILHHQNILSKKKLPVFWAKITDFSIFSLHDAI